MASVSKVLAAKRDLDTAVADKEAALQACLEELQTVLDAAREA